MKNTSRKQRQQAAAKADQRLGPSVGSGYFCVPRESVRQLWPQPGKRWTQLEAFTWLCHQAAASEHTRRLQSGTAHTAVKVQRGQLLVQYGLLADKWHWNVKTARKFLSKLEHAGLITVTRIDQITTLVTMVNQTEAFDTEKPEVNESEAERKWPTISAKTGRTKQ